MTDLLVVSLAASAVMVCTYFALTTRRVGVKAYDVVNVTTAPPIIAYAALVRAWPSVLLSTSYLIAGIVGLWKKRNR